MSIRKRILFAVMCIFTIAILAACKTNEYRSDFDFAVIETTGEKNLSIITYYDKNFKRINQQEFPYGGMTDSFTPAIISDGSMYASPEGIDNGRGLCHSIGMDLTTGEISEFQHDKKYQGEKNLIVDYKRIFVNTNLNGDSFLSYHDTETNKTKDVTLNGIVLGNMAVDQEKLYAFGEDSKLCTAEGEPRTQIYTFDKNTLKITGQKDLGAFYSMVFSVIHDQKLYVPLYNENTGTNSLGIYNTVSGKLRFVKLTDKISDFSNILAYQDKIYISHGSTVTGKGKILSVYNPQNKELKEIDFNHNLSQIVIKHDSLYALDNDPNTETAKLYKYTIGDDNFRLVGSTDVCTKKGSDHPYFYIGSFFVR